MPSVDYVLTEKNSGHPSRVISGLGNAAQVESEGRGKKALWQADDDARKNLRTLGGNI